jgi:glyoxylase-like metal-dependent hydrolase (beta-lactamase superfamily II)
VNRSGTTAAPRELAEGVFWLALGRGLLRSANVFFLRTETGWCLVDAGWADDAAAIRDAAGYLFGLERPSAVLLTHAHPDHAGALPELARRWELRAWVHPAEMPIALGDARAITYYAGPLDRWVILPVMRLSGRARLERMLARSSLRDVVQPLEYGLSPACLPGWETIPTPGHTPGHVAFMRSADRVAITGDALLPLDLNAPLKLLRRERTLAGPPWIATWSWPAATASAVRVAAKAPSVIAGGHGAPMTGWEAIAHVRAFLSAQRH